MENGCAISSDRRCQAWLVGFDGIMYDANDFSEVDWYPSELRIGVSPEGKISERMALLGGSSQGLISGYKPPFISHLCHLDGERPYLGD